MDMKLMIGDCKERLKDLPDESVDSIVTDPPYELGIMGKAWDSSGIAYDVDLWRECLRVLKPGGHLLSFGGSRTYHRMTVAIEDAGFEIRDMIEWLYGSGFPKSHNVSKAIDKAAGVEGEVIGDFPNDRPNSHSKNAIPVGSAGLGKGTKMRALVTPEAAELEGWGTALKPAHEPIVVARKPFKGTVAENVLEHGTGAINIDGCRVKVSDTKEYDDNRRGFHERMLDDDSRPYEGGWKPNTVILDNEIKGRWPANVIFSHHPECIKLGVKQVGSGESKLVSRDRGAAWRELEGLEGSMGATPAIDNFGAETIDDYQCHAECPVRILDEQSGASRFFYCAKPSKAERNEGCDDLEAAPKYRDFGLEERIEGGKATNKRTNEEAVLAKNSHTTVKPVVLMRYLCRLVTPGGGVVLDPFMGSGTTGIAACLEGLSFIGIELSEEYMTIAEARIAAWRQYQDTDEKMASADEGVEWI